MSSDPRYQPIVATELVRSSSAEHSTSSATVADGAGNVSVKAGAGGLTPTVSVTLNRKNHDPYRAFVQGKFLEEGYAHLSPKSLGPTPYDGMLCCMLVVGALPGVLTCALIMVAHSGWWMASAAAGSDDPLVEATATVHVGDTAHFRTIVTFSAMQMFLAYVAYCRCVLIHRELVMSTVPRLSAAERLARFGDNDLGTRLMNFLYGCTFAHVALCPPTFHPVGIIISQLFAGGAAVTGLTGCVLKYATNSLLMHAAPFVRDKTSLMLQGREREQSTGDGW